MMQDTAARTDAIGVIAITLAVLIASAAWFGPLTVRELVIPTVGSGFWFIVRVWREGRK
jgi:hypothetical protein